MRQCGMANEREREREIVCVLESAVLGGKQ